MTETTSAVQAVLFDFDGTFADTAPDMASALNRLRLAHGLPPLPLNIVRPHVSRGARGMIGVGFGLNAEDVGYAALRDTFLDDYFQHLCIETVLFPGTADLIASLQQRDIKWGIVTNKAARFTLPLLATLGFDTSADCIVCGDTCARAKPYPDPLLHAARLIGVEPAHCLYVGDDARDIQAANAAGMRGIVARYGYLGVGAPPADWNAFHIIDAPNDLLALL